MIRVPLPLGRQAAPKSLPDFQRVFPDESACIAYLILIEASPPGGTAGCRRSNTALRGGGLVCFVPRPYRYYRGFGEPARMVCLRTMLGAACGRPERLRCATELLGG